MKLEAVLDSLVELEDDALSSIESRCRELKASHDKQRKEQALEAARTILMKAGLSLKDVAKPQKNGSKGPTYHAGRQYLHPANKTLTWNGKVQKPNWLRELEAQGSKAVELP